MDSLKFFSVRGIILFAILISFSASCDNEKKIEEVLYPETTANPPGGSYPARNFPVVTLECNKPATIYYTLNGELPQIGRSYTYSGKSPVTGIEIRSDTTLRFFAIDDEGNQENVKTESYTIDPPPVTAASPRGGAYKTPVRVSLIANEEAKIYYTLDGSTPDKASFVYTEPILIAKPGTTVLKFMATDHQGNDEETRVEQYVIDTMPPLTDAIPAGGRYPSLQSITLSADEPATIYYTVCNGIYDPSQCPEPDITSPDVQFGDTTVAGINIDTGVLKYFSVDRVGNREAVRTQVYLLGDSPFTYAYPGSGIYNSPVLVQLYSDILSGATATVYYTTDGTTPTLSSTSCLSPCNILVYLEGVTLLKFFAQDSFGNTEPVRTETYTIDSVMPATSASTASGEYIGSQSITLTASEQATVYYTLDGSEPVLGNPTTLSGTSPVSGILIDRDTTLRFFSIDTAGNAESPKKSETYSILYRFIEEFSDSLKKDPNLTDAEWDTASGEARLKRGVIPVVKSVPTGGSSYGFDIYDSKLFLADGSRGIKVYDLSFPTDPVLLGTYPAPPGETFYSIIVRNNIAFSGTNRGLVILDVSDPERPLFLSRWSLSSGSVFDTLFYGDYILAASGSAGLWVIDVSDANNPAGIVNLALTDNAVRLASYSTILFVADSQGDLKVIDIRDPANPALLRTISFPGGVTVLTISGSRLLVGTDNGVIYKELLEDPEKPIFVTSLSISQNPIRDLLSSGNLLYAATGSEIIALNLSDPLNLRFEGGSPAGSSPERIRIFGNYMISSGSSLLSLRMVEVKTPGEISSSVGFSARRAVDFGNLVLIPSGLDGVKIVDIADPESPLLYSGYSTSGFSYDATRAGNYALVASGSAGLEILNIYNPASIQYITTIPTLGSATDIVTEGGFAFLADGAGGLRIIDISSISSPAVVGSCDSVCLGANGILVDVHGNTAYLGLDTNQIALVDISDKANPGLIQTISTAGAPEDILISGNYLFVAEGAAGIEVFYVANPAFPIRAGALSTTDARGLAISGTELYVADNSSVLFVDISDPRVPFIFRNYPADATGLIRWAEYLLVADGFSGINIVEHGLESIHYLSPGTAVSLNINPVSRKVKSAKIAVQDDAGVAGSILYYLSNNGGTDWLAVTPGGSLSNFSTVDNDLRWRAVLSSTDLRRTPRVDKIEVLYKYAD